MVNSAVLKAIEDEKKEFVVHHMESLKSFMKKKIHDSEMGADDVCDMIDAYLKTQMIANKKIVPSKKKTFYAHFTALKIAEIKEDEKEFDDDDKTPPNTYMTKVGECWRVYKETDDFSKDREKWIEETFPDTPKKVVKKEEVKKQKSKKVVKKKKKERTDIILMESESDEE
tara:strand:- start:570 stop:1082 length:513 start_codon:yes stop_codon:yes gene_type:complete